MSKQPIRQEYVDLLKKFAYNSDVEQLLVEVVLDGHRVVEQCYIDTGSYPPNRDLLGKLQQDLRNAKSLLKNRGGDIKHEIQEVINGNR